MSKKPFGKVKIFSAVIILIFVCSLAIIILFARPQTKVKLNEDRITIKSAFTIDVTIKYHEISSIEITESIDEGSKVVGLNMRKYQSGTFKNDAYGDYTLCVLIGIEKYIIIHYDEKKIVFNYNTVEETVELYNALKIKIGE